MNQRRLSLLRHAPCASRHRQRGSVMWLVVLLTVIGSLLAMSMSSTLLAQFRSVRNERDLAIARQAAEAALRDAEADVSCQHWATATSTLQQSINPTTPRTHCLSLAPVCAQLMPTSAGPGLRLLGRKPGATPPAIAWDTAPTACLDGSCAVEFGSQTGVPALSGVSQPPRYHIDVLDAAQTGDAGGVPLFRLSARGYGATSGSYVDLQEIYRPCR